MKSRQHQIICLVNKKNNPRKSGLFFSIKIKSTICAKKRTSKNTCYNIFMQIKKRFAKKMHNREIL